MRPDYERAVERLLDLEGGFVDHPDDPGGATRWGLSLRWYRREVDEAATVDTIRALTRDDAVRLYRVHWWDRYRYGELADQAIAERVLDLAVWMGPSPAHRLLQQAARAAGHRVDIDGALGPLTRAAVARSDPGALLAALRSEAAGRVRLLCAKRPQFETFRRGWIRRAYS